LSPFYVPNIAIIWDKYNSFLFTNRGFAYKFITPLGIGFNYFIKTLIINEINNQ